MDLDTQLEIAGIECDQETVDDILSRHKSDNLAKIANICYYYGSIAIPISDENSLNSACAGDSLKAVRHLIAQGHRPNNKTLRIICNNNSYRVLLLLQKTFPGFLHYVHPNVLNRLCDSEYRKIIKYIIPRCVMTRRLARIIYDRVEPVTPYVELLATKSKREALRILTIDGEWILARRLYDVRLNIDIDQLLVVCCKGNPESIPWLIGIGARMDHKDWLPFRLLCAYNPDTAIEFLDGKVTHGGPSEYVIWRNERGKIIDHSSRRNWDMKDIDVSVCNYEAYRIAREYKHWNLANKLKNHEACILVILKKNSSI